MQLQRWNNKGVLTVVEEIWILCQKLVDQLQVLHVPTNTSLWPLLFYIMYVLSVTESKMTFIFETESFGFGVFQILPRVIVVTGEKADVPKVVSMRA